MTKSLENTMFSRLLFYILFFNYTRYDVKFEKAYIPPPIEFNANDMTLFIGNCN